MTTTTCTCTGKQVVSYKIICFCRYVTHQKCTMFRVVGRNDVIISHFAGVIAITLSLIAQQLATETDNGQDRPYQCVDHAYTVFHVKE